MAFDNSFVVMNEEEMHDVNGGWWRWKATTFANNVFALAVGTGIIKLLKFALNISGAKLSAFAPKVVVKAAITKVVSTAKLVGAFFANLTVAGAIAAVAILAGIGYTLGILNVF